MNDTSKRDKILQAALNLIAVHGFHGSPISMIADKSGVGAGTIYRYFKDKDELIVEINRILVENILQEIEEGFPINKGVKERYVYLCRTLFKYFVIHPLHFSFLEQYSNSPYGESVNRERITGNTRASNRFQKIIEKGIKQKVVKDMPLFVCYSLTFGPIIMLIRNHIRGLIEIDNANINQVIEASWDALKE